MAKSHIFRWTAFCHGLSLFLTTKPFQKSSAECIKVNATLQLVPECPQTQEAWREAAARKDCGSIHNHCYGDFVYVYHCVMNTWQNETVEVCAPIELIFGRTCTEYNFVGGVIQRNAKVACTTCPVVYRSNETFKYPECYRHVTPAVPLTEPEVTTKMIADKCIKISETLQLVRECPQTQEAWEEAAARKDCGGIHNYCNGDFVHVYHCVMNTWLNETVEVCAPIELIFGRTCTEYNFVGGVILRNAKVACTTCPLVYRSNETFKYPECYRHVTPAVPLTESEVTTKVSVSSFDETTTKRDISTTSFVRNGEIQDQHDTNKIGIILGSVAGCVFVILVICILFIRRFREQSENTGPNCKSCLLNCCEREVKSKREIKDRMHLKL